MPEHQVFFQVPVMLHQTSTAESSYMRRFSVLSAILHVVALVVFIILAGGKTEFNPPVKVITVDLSAIEAPHQLVVPLDHPRSESVPKIVTSVAKTVHFPVDSVSEARQQPATPVAGTVQSTLPKAAQVPVAAVSTDSPGHQVMTAKQSTADVATAQTVKNLTMATSAPPPQYTPVSVRTVDKDGIRNGFMQRCRERIERYKEYPVMARKGRAEGMVVIRGILLRDGNLQQCSVVRSSGSGLLDNAAMRAVRSVGKFPPVPPELGGDDLAFELPISFRLVAE